MKSMVDPRDETTRDPQHDQRRSFLGKVATGAMAGGLAAGYGLFAVDAGRFLYPANVGSTVWHFVATLEQLTIGQAMRFQTPTGAHVVVARQRQGDSAEDFIALSSVCPHLGCAVHWEPQHDRFFCPCHNGAFDAAGNATEGPPAAAKQVLSRFPLKVEAGMLFMQIALDSVTGPKET